jgi:hypothetical protein
MRPSADKSDSNNRADEVRRRRTQRSQERLSSVSSRATSPVVKPSHPVTVRGSAYGTPIHQQTKTRARRQLYLTMDRAAGTEVRLPAIPVIRPGWRLLSGLIAILAAVGIFSLFNSPYCQVGSVEVKGLERLAPAEITAMLSLENRSIVEIDSAQVMQKINTAYPDLINVRVGVDLPNIVTINAEERKPVMALKKGDAITWVDEKGVLFPARGDAGPLVTVYSDDDVPLAPPPINAMQLATQEAAAEDPSATPDPQTAKNAVPVTGLRELDPALMSAALGLSKMLPPDTELAYSKDHGLGWIDHQGWQVFIGTDLKDFEEKYNMYQQITSKLTEEGIKPSLVSVEHLDAPFYRPEQ